MAQPTCTCNNILQSHYPCPVHGIIGEKAYEERGRCSSCNNDLGLFKLCSECAKKFKAYPPQQEQPSLGGWQPIETAPKDGNHIVLYRPEIQFIGYYGGTNSGWRINAPNLPAMWPLPTHWKPRSAPPTT